MSTVTETSRTAAVGAILEAARTEGRTSLSAPEAKRVCDAYGISVPREGLATSADEAVTIAEDIGFPVVLKIVSPDILHKTEAGGVLVGLASTDDVSAGYETIVENARSYDANAEVTGVQVQQMLSEGTEVLIGAVTDPTFGPVVTFGIGGVLVEVMRDVTFRLAPTSRADALEMVDGIRAAEVLRGVRGRAGVDRYALAATIAAVSELVADFPQITEVDLNPVLASEEGAVAVDARFVVSFEPSDGRPPRGSEGGVFRLPRQVRARHAGQGRRQGNTGSGADPIGIRRDRRDGAPATARRVRARARRPLHRPQHLRRLLHAGAHERGLHHALRRGGARRPGVAERRHRDGDPRLQPLDGARRIGDRRPGQQGRHRRGRPAHLLRAGRPHRLHRPPHGGPEGRARVRGRRAAGLEDEADRGLEGRRHARRLEGGGLAHGRARRRRQGVRRHPSPGRRGPGARAPGAAPIRPLPADTAHAHG